MMLKKPQKLLRFLSHQHGSIVIVSALILPILILLCAGVLQYNYTIRERDKMQQTLDQVTLMIAARMVGHNDLSKAHLNSEGVEHYKATLPDKIYKYIGSNDYDADRKESKVTGKATADFPLIFPFSMLKGPTHVEILSVVSVNPPDASALDVAMCVDITGSMLDTLSAVKANVLNFKDNLSTELRNRGMAPFDQLRLRVIFFADFNPRGKNPPLTTGPYPDLYGLKASPFYDMAVDSDRLKNFVEPEVLNDGGDWPESGLECLNAAMESKWTKPGDRTRSGTTISKSIPVIAIYTDAAAKDVNHFCSINNNGLPQPYPLSMPRSYDAFLNKWSDNNVIDQKNKLLLFYGQPDIPSKAKDLCLDAEMRGWQHIMKWPKFTVAGSLISASTNMVATLADAIAKNTHRGLHIAK